MPLAREEENGDPAYVVCDHPGTPRELMSEDGKTIWAAEYSTWGDIRRIWQAANDEDDGGPDGSFQGYDPSGKPVYSTRVTGSVGAFDGNAALKSDPNPNPYLCPIRFQGQWADQETGLHYNRFRYYDADAAQYLSPDPIGLEGGLNLQAYVPSPTTWIDPFGLAKKKCCCKTSKDARREAMRQADIPTSQQPFAQFKNASGFEYLYRIPAAGGGTKVVSVQQQTMDRSHPGQPHWEAGDVKINDDTGEIRRNNYGRSKLENEGKKKVDYGGDC